MRPLEVIACADTACTHSWIEEIGAEFVDTQMLMEGLERAGKLRVMRCHDHLSAIPEQFCDDGACEGISMLAVGARYWIIKENDRAIQQLASSQKSCQPQGIDLAVNAVIPNIKGRRGGVRCAFLPHRGVAR